MHSLNSPFTTSVNPNHALFLQEGLPAIQGWVVHKVAFNGYKFSLWYNNQGELTDIEKFIPNTYHSVRIGKQDRAYFAKFSSTKTGLSLAPYRHLFYGLNDPEV